MATPTLMPENAVSIIRGSSKTYEIVVTDDATGKPIDLTGARVILTVKKDIEDTDPAFPAKDYSQTNSPAVFVPREGKVRIQLDPTDTGGDGTRPPLDPGDYTFDVWVIFPNGKRYPVIGPSVFNVQLGVTLVP